MSSNSASVAVRAASSEAPMDRGRHPLFAHYPLNDTVRLSTGLAPTPYHVYDGYGLFIGGTIDGDAASELLAPEQVVPVRTTCGRAFMGLWICNFLDASLGAHHELQFSIYASAQAIAPVKLHRLSIIELMLTRPDVKMLCHGLWNDTSRVVAYNRECLALDARTTDSVIERDDESIRFAFEDRGTQASIIAGRIDHPRRTSLGVIVALMARLGVRRFGDVSRQPWLHTQILNPVGAGLAHNATADSYTKADASAVRYFDPSRHRLQFGETRYSRLGFQPQFVQSMDGFKFVYLAPR